MQLDRHSFGDRPSLGSTESSDARTLLGRPSRLPVRVLLDARRAHVERRCRQAITLAYRARRTADIDAARRALPVDFEVDPVDALRADVDAGLFPRATETVTETVRLLDPDKLDRHWLTWRLDSPGYLVHVERVYREYRGRRAVTEAAMRLDPIGDRPASAVRAASTVNAQSTSSASRRVRVPDSHDARPAIARRTARPASGRQLALDVTRRIRSTQPYRSTRVDPALLRRADVGGFARVELTARLARATWSTVEPTSSVERRATSTRRPQSTVTRAVSDVALLDRLGVRPAAESD
jgi:hypothetical protein